MATEAQDHTNRLSSPHSQKFLVIRSITLFLCAFCAFLWLKNLFNQRNPRLINYLHAFGIFTLVKMSLQISSFMQNKANFRKSQMNVTKVLTKDYENKTLGEYGKKQSQTKPNKAKFKKAKMNVTSILTVGYENKSPIRAPKKQSQISKRQKPMQTSLPKGITKNTALLGSDKTNPNEPNTTPIKPNACPPSVWRVRGKKMLLRMTINTRRNYNGRGLAEKAGNRINSISPAGLLYFQGKSL